MQPGNSAPGIVGRTIAVPDTGYVEDISGGFRGHPVHAQPPLRNVDVRQLVPGCASGVMVEVEGREPFQPRGWLCVHGLGTSGREPPLGEAVFFPFLARVSLTRGEFMRVFLDGGQGRVFTPGLGYHAGLGAKRNSLKLLRGELACCPDGMGHGGVKK